MINFRNREIVAIVRLKSRTEGHVASLSEDFQTIRAMVEEEKQEAILDRWISRKISETYFRINDNWRNCDFQRNEWLQQQ
jgi:peptidyl-prolyl cis-trans isomerase SurA